MILNKILVVIPYFFGYKTEFFSFQNKTDLHLWGCLGRVKLVL